MMNSLLSAMMTMKFNEIFENFQSDFSKKRLEMSNVFIHFDANVVICIYFCILNVLFTEFVEIARNEDIFSTNYVGMVFN